MKPMLFPVAVFLALALESRSEIVIYRGAVHSKHDVAARDGGSVPPLAGANVLIRPHCAEANADLFLRGGRAKNVFPAAASRLPANYGDGPFKRKAGDVKMQ